MQGGRRSAPRTATLVARVFAAIAVSVLCLFVVSILFLYARQRKMYYQPKSPRRGPTPANIGLRHWNLKIDERIDTWWIPAAPGKATVLLCHGNAGNMSHRLPLISVIRQTGLGVVIFDYSGYGNTAGTPCEKTLREDATAVWVWMKGRIPPHNIVVLGRSLGGGVACDLVYMLVRTVLASCTRPSKHRLRAELPRALVMDSTFTSMPEACTHNLPRCARFLARMVKDKYDTLDKLPLISAYVPTVVAHTLADKTVPFEQARRNAQAAQCPLVVLPRGGHNDGYMRSSSVYQRLLIAVSQL